MKIELLQQFDSLLLSCHTIDRGVLVQKGQLNIWEQQDSPDSKPASIPWMDANTTDLLDRKQKQFEIMNFNASGISEKHGDSVVRRLECCTRNGDKDECKYHKIVSLRAHGTHMLSKFSVITHLYEQIGKCLCLVLNTYCSSFYNRCDLESRPKCWIKKLCFLPPPKPTLINKYSVFWL